MAKNKPNEKQVLAAPVKPEGTADFYRVLPESAVIPLKDGAYAGPGQVFKAESILCYPQQLESVLACDPPRIEPVDLTSPPKGKA